ncbi:MAG: hypothetical protein ACK40U_09855, partial [Fervidobacterium pennivorans]
MIKAKKIYLLLFYTFYQSILVAQLKIEDIKTDKDVVKFIEYFGGIKNQQWRRVSLEYKDKIFLKYTSKEDIATIDSIAKQKWVIEDFNNDGEKDLIVACKIYTQFEILGFISYENEGFAFDSCFYSLINLSTEYSRQFPSGIYRVDNGGQPLIKLVKYHRSNIKQELKKNFKEDTLLYKISSFVEYDDKDVTLAKFDSIIFRRTYTWDPQPPLLKLYADGTFKLFSNKYGFNSDTSDWKEGVFTAKVGEKTIKIFNEILGYINYNQLSSTYRIAGITDLARFRTEVYYKGTMKIVDDYGGQGTYGLRLLYRELLRLKAMLQ